VLVSSSKLEPIHPRLPTDSLLPSVTPAQVVMADMLLQRPQSPYLPYYRVPPILWDPSPPAVFEEEVLFEKHRHLPRRQIETR
jgi:hypothetical protein